MKKILPGILLLVFVGGLLWGFPLSGVRADELTKTTQELNAKKEQLRKAEAALKSAREREAALSSGVSGLQVALEVAQAEAVVKQAEAEEALADFARQEALLQQREELYAANTRGLYKRMMAARAMAVATLLDAENIVTYARLSDYQAKMLEQEQQRVLGLAEEVSGLEKRKIELKGQADKALADKKNLEQRMANLQWQIANARYTQTASNSQIVNLNKDIKGLTAKQQAILDAKLAANNAGGSLGDKAPVTTTPGAPGFSGPAYAFSSYGVPHRVGMSQYGAAGRAYTGQNYGQIINAYFHNVTIQKVDMPATIEVQGVGTVPFEDRYLKLVREMPRSWPEEALKAQAILVRTYAYKWMRDGRGAICTTQACQVYKHSDNPNSTDQWDLAWFAAVKATEGMVVMQSGYPVGTYYAASSGGISQQSGQVWSTNLPYLKIAEDCNGTWPKNCYERRGGPGMQSPWFFKPWGDRTGKSETSTGNNCNGCNPWLTKAEMVDLFNAALLYQKMGSASGVAGGVSYDLALSGSSAATIVAALQAVGEQPIGDFAAIEVYQDKGIGQTSQVQVMGGPRTVTNLTGKNMRAVVNLRAPGTVMLNSTLFDVIVP